MAVESSSPATVRSRAVQSSSVASAVDAPFEERWAAWRANGLRHDLAVRRRMAFIALVVALGTGLVMVGLVIAGASR